MPLIDGQVCCGLQVELCEVISEFSLFALCNILICATCYLQIVCRINQVDALSLVKYCVTELPDDPVSESLEKHITAIKMFSGPSIYIFGAFFPSWMLCLFLALIIVLLIRVVFIRTGIDDLLTFRLTTYTAMLIAVASVLALVIYGR